MDWIYRTRPSKFVRQTSCNCPPNFDWKNDNISQRKSDQYIFVTKEILHLIVKFKSIQYSQPLELAYDVGCGSGESSRVLTPYFKHVVGTDVNSEAIMEAEGKRGDQTCSQIEQAEGGWAHQNLTYQSVCGYLFQKP